MKRIKNTDQLNASVIYTMTQFLAPPICKLSMSTHKGLSRQMRVFLSATLSVGGGEVATGD